jgi:hypothetical protein
MNVARAHNHGQRTIGSLAGCPVTAQPTWPWWRTGWTVASTKYSS